MATLKIAKTNRTAISGQSWSLPISTLRHQVAQEASIFGLSLRAQALSWRKSSLNCVLTLFHRTWFWSEMTLLSQILSLWGTCPAFRWMWAASSSSAESPEIGISVVPLITTTIKCFKRPMKRFRSWSDCHTWVYRDLHRYAMMQGRYTFVRKWSKVRCLDPG